jgi:hypothetical protein
MYDLNNAGPRVEDDGASPSPKYDVHEFKRAMQIHALPICVHLFPKGVLTRDQEFVVANLDGSPGQSLKIHLGLEKFGVWSDFATGDSGGDLIALWMKARRVGFLEALKEIQAWLNIPGTSNKVVGTITPAPHSVTMPRKPREPLPPPTATWNYVDKDGKIVGWQTRYDWPDGKKEFRPYSVADKKATIPNPRPLCNLQLIAQNDHVVIVEGEKCADVLVREFGTAGTTCMGGSSVPIKKVDLEPLRDKHVTIWPDNDEPGMKYAANLTAALQGIVKSLRIVKPPADKPPKWDVADALAEGFDVKEFLSTSDACVTTPIRFDPSKWTASTRFAGTPPGRKWALKDVAEERSVLILAAEGETGKGMILTDLALKIASIGWGSITNGFKAAALGTTVEVHGRAFILSAEDNADEIHRRLHALDPGEKLALSGDNLVIFPLPNMGGPAPFIKDGPQGPEETSEFKEIKKMLSQYDNIKLIAIDPLSSFVMADINADPAVAAYTMGVLASLAMDTGALVVVSHHNRKPTESKYDVRDSEPSTSQMRYAVRGSSALIDGCRGAFAFTAMSEHMGKQTCKALEREWYPNSCYYGVVIKSNGPANRSKQRYIRNQKNGLLECVESQFISVQLPKRMEQDLFLAALLEQEEADQPFSNYGTSNGIYSRRSELPEPFKSWGKNKLQDYVLYLLLEDPPKIVKACRQGSVAKVYLVTPSGTWAGGEGIFAAGAGNIDEQANE